MLSSSQSAIRFEPYSNSSGFGVTECNCERSRFLMGNRYSSMKNVMSSDFETLLEQLITKDPNTRLGCASLGAVCTIKDQRFFKVIHKVQSLKEMISY